MRRALIILSGSLLGLQDLSYAQDGRELFKRAERVEARSKGETKLNLDRENKVKTSFQIKRDVKIEKRPEFDYEKYKRQKVKMVFAIRQKAISQSEKLMKQVRTQDARIKVMLNLAELYMENYDYYSLVEHENYNQSMRRWKGKGKTPKIDQRRSKYYRDRAYKLYLQLYKALPNHPRRDEILYFLGYIDSTLDRFSSAMRYFRELLERYPRSTMAPEAELKMGDYYFNQRDLDRALQYYGSLARRNHPLSLYARYKMAWCFYNQKRYNESIRAFQEVVEKSGEDNEKGSFGLKAEALDDLVLAYAEALRPQDAKEYFSRYGGERYYYKMLTKLADIYFTTGRHVDSMQVYQELLSIDANHIDAPNYQRNIIESYRVLNKKEAMRKALETYVTNYNMQSEWAQANRKSPEQVRESVEAGEFAMRKAAKEAHFFGQKTKSKGEYQNAIKLYSLYLRYFPESEASYEMTFFFAEALYQVGEYKSALQSYKKVSDFGKGKKYYADSTYGGISAFMADYQKLLGEKKPPKKTKDNLQAVELETYEKEYLSLVDKFINDLPNDNRTPDLQYHAAYLCYDKNQFDCSNKRFNWLIKHNPRDKRSPDAAHMILDLMNLQERYGEINQQARKYLEMKNLGDDKFKAEMREIISKSRFKELEKLEAQGKYKEAAQGYASLGQSEKGMGLADKALYNAAVNFNKAGDTASAAKYYNAVATQYPQSQLSAASILFVANYHKDRYHVNEAAKAFQKYIQISPKAKDAANAQYDIAVLYEAGQNYSEAGEAYRSYASTYKNREDAPLALRKSCEMHWKKKNAPQAISCYSSVKSQFPSSTKDHVYADGAIIDIYEARKEKEAKRRLQTKIVESYGRNYDSLPADAKAIIAEAHFQEARETLEKFTRIALDTTKPQELQKRIQSKLQIVNQLDKETTEILKYGSGEWGVAALYNLGLAYHEFADSLLKTPKPKNLTQQQLELYDAELRNIATPLDVKAMGHLEKAYATAQNLDVYTEWTQRVYAQLHDYDQVKYPIDFELGIQSGHVSEFIPSER